eukprot:3926787-Rhodomonas_salina.1
MPVEEVLEKEPQQDTSAESVSADEGDEERSVNCVAGASVGVPEKDSQTAQLRGRVKGHCGGGGRAAAAIQGAAVRAKKKHDKEMQCIPQGRPRQNNPPHNAPGPSQSGSTAADPSKDTEETDSHPDYVHADVDAKQESGSFTAREDEALVEIQCQHEPHIQQCHNNLNNKVWEQILALFIVDKHVRVTMCSVWTLKKLQNHYSWLHGEYATWYREVDSLCEKLSGTDCVEVQTYLDNPPKQMELFDSYNMNNKPSIRPLFLLSVANVEEMVARERSVMLPQTELVL